ncbi:glycosyltransferase family 4 protein (plasmid) [Sulfitobacter sp. OXR-159]|uniref:glycosyltransferase family 4 protein n=1 Tax=Sulfitobacter sp. OXR-159 TaxID=3100174 RepID=UPI002AC90012|nr:glycosyltransferase family 4 protein [Sulfitobacter sp. OXR-159]WPZ31535.1 glycosyltransferase family 4 protein [Sulfitobacter sp. OXR-159]
MNILLLSRYTRMGASSRLRTMQYLPALEREGFNVQVAPFFDDTYLHALYSGQRKHTSAATYLFKRIRQLRMHPTPDMLWIEKEALPWIPWLFERVVLPRGVPVVSDYDDAVFHRYDKHRIRAVRTILGRKIENVMSASALVMAGNSYLSDYARQSGARQVKTVPTIVDIDAYQIGLHTVSKNKLSVGWIGTPQTWQALAHPIHDILTPLLKERDAMFLAVGAGMKPEVCGTLQIQPWTEDTEVQSIQKMDIGVMPLPDTPWTRGKCGYKLIQYMACGLPVVASPVGVNRDLVEHGVNGFLAESDDEWCAAIKALLNDPDLRRRMGEAGRQKVEARYSLQVWGPRVALMLRRVIENRATI